MKRNKVDKRKILLLLPVVFLFFAGLAFYLFTAGKATSLAEEIKPKGINASLPDAQFKIDKPEDKMSIYQLSENDSTADGGIEAVAGRLGFGTAEDPQAAKIKEKLAAINREINSPIVPAKSPNEAVRRNGYSTVEAPLSKDVAKLESLMKNMQSPPEDDPEMRQLNSLMDKIMAVQNPEMAKQTYFKIAAEGTDSLFQAIPAVIANNQKAVQGSVVELRLLDTVKINGQLIPKGHAVFGLAEFSNQRLNLQIKNIRLGTSVIPVKLTVFDKRDAMPGINAPEALLNDAIANGSSGAISSIGITGFDLTTQIAGAGLDAAKSLFNKKIKRVKQKLKAGYPLLLRDNTKKQK